jgi:hypothetical protein
MSRLAAVALAALAGLALAQPAAAQWKWRDAGGRVVYSDRPPPSNVPDSAILQRPRGMTPQAVPPSPSGPSLVPGPVAVIGGGAAAAGSASAAKGVDPELEARRRKEAEAKENERKEAEAKVAAAKAANCLQAQTQLKTLQDGVRIGRTNAKGEREILDDKGRAEEEKRVRAIIASDCGGAQR